MLQSDNALLEMIFLNGEEMNKAAKGFTVNDDFDAETFEYTIGFRTELNSCLKLHGKVNCRTNIIRLSIRWLLIPRFYGNHHGCFREWRSYQRIPFEILCGNVG